MKSNPNSSFHLVGLIILKEATTSYLQLGYIQPMDHRETKRRTETHKSGHFLTPCTDGHRRGRNWIRWGGRMGQEIQQVWAG